MFVAIFSSPPSAAAAGAAAGVALQAGAVAHQGEVPALAAGVALVALHPRLGAGVDRGDARLGRDARREAREGAELEDGGGTGPALQHHQLLRQALPDVAGRGELLDHRDRLPRGRAVEPGEAAAGALGLAAADGVEALARRLHVREV